MLAPIEEIFCEIDDFCKEYYNHQSPHLLPNPKRKRKRPCKLALSEIMTIVILFHLSHYRTFQDYYHDCVVKHLFRYFPKLVSYNRFLELKHIAIPALASYMKYKAGKQTGLYYVDSTTLKVCRNQRIHRHKVFDGIAARGMSSMGWFFGFKLHIVINHLGEVMSFLLTPGNIDDRKPLEKLFKGLKGIACGDKGYLSKKHADTLETFGLKLITKQRNNMKKVHKSRFEKYLIAQRAIVETVIEQLKSICQIEHSRHRKPDNFLVNCLAALVAYTLKPRKPAINQYKLDKNINALMSS